jgi:aquaporin related protein
MDNNPTTKTHSLGNWTSGSRNTIRNHFVAMTGEFIGTFFFLFCSFAPTQIAVTALKNGPSTGPVIPDTSALFFIAASFGIAVTVNVWAFYRINGGMLNPAVCLFLLSTFLISVSICTS